MGVLTKLGKADASFLKAIKDMGAVDVIAAALDEWPDDKELLNLGAQALGTLADKHVRRMTWLRGRVVQGVFCFCRM